MILSQFTLSIRSDSIKTTIAMMNDMPDLWEGMCDQIDELVVPALDQFVEWIEKRIPDSKASWNTEEAIPVSAPGPWGQLAIDMLRTELDEQGMAELARELLEKQAE